MACQIIQDTPQYFSQNRIKFSVKMEMIHTKIPKSYQIETKRFVLKIPNETEISFVYSATQYRGFNDGMVWEPPKKKEELLESLKSNIEAWENGQTYTFTVIDKETMKLLGRIAIRKTNIENVWKVGFWTHPESQKKGIMTEALNGILKFGFEQLSATQIGATHALWNTGSEKVLTRNGLCFESYEEKGFFKNGKWIPANFLVIDVENWKLRNL
jgi:[ribosomal protein S5]-alanine N-acetyltransferase